VTDPRVARFTVEEEAMILVAVAQSEDGANR
jgi:hypothetical protein